MAESHLAEPAAWGIESPWRGWRHVSIVNLASTPKNGEFPLARTNYQFERRQKELAKKKKKDEKRRRKLEKKEQSLEIEGGAEATPEIPETEIPATEPPGPEPTEPTP